MTLKDIPGGKYSEKRLVAMLGREALSEGIRARIIKRSAPVGLEVLPLGPVRTGRLSEMTSMSIPTSTARTKPTSHQGILKTEDDGSVTEVEPEIKDDLDLNEWRFFNELRPISEDINRALDKGDQGVLVQDGEATPIVAVRDGDGKVTSVVNDQDDQDPEIIDAPDDSLLTPEEVEKLRDANVARQMGESVPASIVHLVENFFVGADKRLCSATVDEIHAYVEPSFHNTREITEIAVRVLCERGVMREVPSAPGQFVRFLF
jgi:hypothetical protein